MVVLLLVVLLKHEYIQLAASGVKVNQKITADWIIQQPIEVKEES